MKNTQAGPKRQSRGPAYQRRATSGRGGSENRGYASPSAFIRAAIRNELDGRAELTGTEERIAAGFDRVSRDIFRVGRGQQAMFALLDAFAKAILTCVPEPPPEARPQAIARAKERYDRLVKPPVRRCLAMRAQPCRIW